MPIHEESLIRPEDLRKHEKLDIDNVDVSGHWSTFIESRVVTEYNEDLEREVAAFPGGSFIHRCWQCGACTNSCTVNAINPDFNPRYWIYLVRLGMEQELLRDKDIIWQCVSCHKCTHVCPRDVEPEGVMRHCPIGLKQRDIQISLSLSTSTRNSISRYWKPAKLKRVAIVRNYFNRTRTAVATALADSGGQKPDAGPALHVADQNGTFDTVQTQNQGLEHIETIDPGINGNERS